MEFTKGPHGIHIALDRIENRSGYGSDRVNEGQDRL